MRSSREQGDGRTQRWGSVDVDEVERVRCSAAGVLKQRLEIRSALKDVDSLS